MVSEQQMHLVYRFNDIQTRQRLHQWKVNDPLSSTAHRTRFGCHASVDLMDQHGLNTAEDTSLAHASLTGT